MSKVCDAVKILLNQVFFFLASEFLSFESLFRYFVPRGKVRTLGDYFDGTGYGKLSILSSNSFIKFYVQSHQMDAVLFYMENEVKNLIHTTKSQRCRILNSDIKMTQHFFDI